MKHDANLLRALTAIVVIAIAPIVHAQSEPSVDAPSAYVAGDKWKFTIVDDVQHRKTEEMYEIVTLVDGDHAWLLATDLMHDSKAWNLMDRRKGQTVGVRAYDPTKPDLQGKPLARGKSDARVQFPLFVGKKYPIRESWPNGKGENWLDATVEGTETITLPAGTFEVWRISFNGRWEHFTDSEERGSTKGMLWYAPTAKRMIKSEQTAYRKGRATNHVVITLTEWTPGNPEGKTPEK